MEDLILNNPVFTGMDEKETDACLRALCAAAREYRKGTLILSAGDTAGSFGIVLKGSVTIEHNDVWGNCTVLSHVGKGQTFAESYAVLRDRVLLVDVRANEDSRILFLSLGRLMSGEIKEDWYGKLIANLLVIASQKNLTLSERSFQISRKSCRGRLLAYLSAVSRSKRSDEFDIPFDRQQLADHLNLERTNMSKELSKMQKEGLIEFRKNHFRLLKKRTTDTL